LKLPSDGWNGIESFDHLVGAGEQAMCYGKKRGAPVLGILR